METSNYWSENWIVLTLFILLIAGIVFILRCPMDVAVFVEVEVTEVKEGLCKGSFAHSGRLLDGFIHPCPEHVSSGDVIECEMGEYDHSLNLWELTPVYLIRGEKKNKT